jgi:O-antigen/teichoic acid export membrane protein
LVVIAIMFVPTLGMFFVWQSLSTIIFAVLFKLSLETTLHGHLILEIDPKIEVIVFKRIWRFVGGMMLISLVASLNTQMDKIAISKLLSLENLGYYTLAVSLAQGISILVSPISMALLPRFTALYSTNKIEEASNLYHKVSLFISILVFSLMSNMAFFSKELIWIWTGKTELALNSYALVPIISFAYAILSLQIIPFNIAIANGYTKLNNLLGIISLFVTIPGYWIATRHSGAIGAAYVFCVVQSTITLVYLYFINEKFLRSKGILHIYFKELSFPLVISTIIAFGFSLIPNLLTNSRIISFSLIGIYTIITFSVTSLILIPMRDIKSIVNLQPLFSKPV